MASGAAGVRPPSRRGAMLWPPRSPSIGMAGCTTCSSGLPDRATRRSALSHELTDRGRTFSSPLGCSGREGTACAWRSTGKRAPGPRSTSPGSRCRPRNPRSEPCHRRPTPSCRSFRRWRRRTFSEPVQVSEPAVPWSWRRPWPSGRPCRPRRLLRLGRRRPRLPGLEGPTWEGRGRVVHSFVARRRGALRARRGGRR